MRQLQPVVWSKGVFLSPQHLQAQDRFFEETLRFLSDALSFRNWGFSSLHIDGTGLSEGQLNVSQASGVFPDGLMLDMPARTRRPNRALSTSAFTMAATGALSTWRSRRTGRAGSISGCSAAAASARAFTQNCRCCAMKTVPASRSRYLWRARTCRSWPRAKTSKDRCFCRWRRSSAPKRAATGWMRNTCRRC